MFKDLGYNITRYGVGVVGLLAGNMGVYAAAAALPVAVPALAVTGTALLAGLLGLHYGIQGGQKLYESWHYGKLALWRTNLTGRKSNGARPQPRAAHAPGRKKGWMQSIKEKFNFGSKKDKKPRKGLEVQFGNNDQKGQKGPTP